MLLFSFAVRADVQIVKCVDEKLGDKAAVPRGVPESEKPPPIPRNYERQPRATELDIVGRIVESPDDFKNLKPGVYVYLIDDAGNTAISHRVPSDVAKDGKFIAAHPGLLKLLETARGGAVQVLGAGEFHVMPNGQVRRITNQANTFHGNTNHLRYSIAHLEAEGLKVEKNTEVWDYSVPDPARRDPHLIAEDDGKVRLMIAADPRLKKVEAALNRAQLLLLAEDPDSTSIGAFDIVKVTNWLMSDKCNLSEVDKALTVSAIAMPNNPDHGAILAVDRLLAHFNKNVEEVVALTTKLEKSAKDYVAFSKKFKKDFPPLQQDKTRPVSPHEFEKIGKIVVSTHEFKNLEPGVYVFLIDDNENLVMSPRAPLKQANDQTYLATHRGLLKTLDEENAGVTNVIAAGEFHVLPNGKIRTLSNRSGSFKGDKKRLDFAVEILKDKGLVIEPWSRLIDASRDAQNPHLRAEEDAALRYQSTKDPELGAMIKSIHAIQTKLLKKIPDLKKPGMIDGAQIVERALVNLNIESVNYIAQRVSWLNDPQEGAYYVYKKFHEKAEGNSKLIKGMISELNMLVDYSLR